MNTTTGSKDMIDVKYIIKAGEEVPESALVIDPNQFDKSLVISEFFFDTIQGEGKYVGTPAAFLRLTGCPLNCVWCDTAAVWKKGHRVSIDWLVDKIVTSGLSNRLRNVGSYHLVVTGGSPLMQENQLVAFFDAFFQRFGFYPCVELENECSRVPGPIENYIACWNNSPKLSSSGVSAEKRIVPGAIRKLQSLYFGDVCYKFVVKDEKDIEELERDFVDAFSIDKGQVYLMPLGADREEYNSNREKVVELAIKYGYRYSPREHIAIWDKKTGI